MKLSITNKDIYEEIQEMSKKSEKILYGNQMMQDFSNKLSERLKFLKPIK